MRCPSLKASAAAWLTAITPMDLTALWLIRSYSNQCLNPVEAGFNVCVA